MVNKIKSNFFSSTELKNKLAQDDNMMNNLFKIAEIVIECYIKGNKVYFCGNGGSFADAQHLSAELNGRFYFDRPPLEVVLLGSNFSYLTAVSNDYSYEDIFKREILSSIKDGDVLICFSTSGNSKNIIKCIEAIKDKNVKTISFLGNDGGIISKISDHPIIIPSNNTARIQECHMLIGHSIIEIVEETLFKI
jgi:D-sedoheptulose 7-phosphate isomerase